MLFLLFAGVPLFDMRLKWAVGAKVTTKVTVFDLSINKLKNLMEVYEEFMMEEVSISSNDNWIFQGRLSRRASLEFSVVCP